jgi:mono/diheme cytochrome c family protein
MKRKLLFAVIMLTLIIVECSKKTVATKDASVSTATGSPAMTTSETTPSESLKGSAEAVMVDASLLIAGKTVYETKCIRCHAIKPLAAFTEPRWDAILKIMAPKANLTQVETQQVAAYVKANAKGK